MNGHIDFNQKEIAAALDPHDRLESYFSLLLDENSRVNLVSRETEPEALLKQAAESLLPFMMIDRSFASYLDIGSGGGFPAIPLIFSGRIPGSRLLMERVGKKAEALKRMLGSLELTAEVLSENFPFGPTKASFDLITLRWVKLDRSLLKKIVSRLKSDGLFIHYSSESLADEKIMAQTTLFEDAQAGITKGFTVYRQV